MVQLCSYGHVYRDTVNYRDWGPGTAEGLFANRAVMTTQDARVANIVRVQESFSRGYRDMDQRPIGCQLKSQNNLSKLF